MKKMSVKRKAAVSLLAVSIIIVASLVYWMQSGNSGQIQSSSQEQKETTAVAPKQFEGTHVSFEYSPVYLSRRLEPRGTDIELHQFDAGTTYVKKMALSVSELPDGTLNTHSAYLFRKARTDMYRQRDVDAGSLQVQVWESLDGKEQTVFITQNKRVAVLAFTQEGGDSKALTAEVDALIRSFAWEQSDAAE